MTPFAYYYRLEQPRPLPGQHGSPNTVLTVYLTVRKRWGSTSTSNKSIDISCFRPHFLQPIGFIDELGCRIKAGHISMRGQAQVVSFLLFY